MFAEELQSIYDHSETQAHVVVDYSELNAKFVMAESVIDTFSTGEIDVQYSDSAIVAQIQKAAVRLHSIIV
jgi:hypothetical protein